MIAGLGIDVVEIDRIQHSLTRFGAHFLQRVLTKKERAALPATPASYVAARFAAKEAAVKALGTGFAQGITLQDIEIVNGSMGEPCMSLHGAAQQRMQTLGATRIYVSLTHSRQTAAAVVILEV
jgi:holo-[acyl-carrier protein] synthase